MFRSTRSVNSLTEAERLRPNLMHTDKPIYCTVETPTLNIYSREVLKATIPLPHFLPGVLLATHSDCRVSIAFHVRFASQRVALGILLAAEVHQVLLSVGRRRLRDRVSESGKADLKHRTRNTHFALRLAVDRCGKS